MEKYKLSNVDIVDNYFHFTRKKNLESIQKLGLLPKISIHALTLEDTKKVFFVEGLDNLLILFDCWIHVLSVYPFIPGMFNLGAKLMQYKWFPKIFINAYFKYMDFAKFHKHAAHKYFDRFLKNYVLLNLNLEENTDFSYNDIDQIKQKGYSKECLIKAGYSPLYSDLKSVKMDKWNLHTFTNHVVSPIKIKLCYVSGNYSMTDILNYALNNTNLDIEKICPNLFSYLNSGTYKDKKKDW
ncbi:MAG: hypothetical protein OSJ65_07730 [Bacilli bacterium]|nr:hypothetical protein [Bacilli bacterium]